MSGQINVDFYRAIAEHRVLSELSENVLRDPEFPGRRIYKCSRCGPNHDLDNLQKIAFIYNYICEIRQFVFPLRIGGHHESSTVIDTV